MNNKLKLITILFSHTVFFNCWAQVKNLKVSSPDQSILFSVSIHGNQPVYSINRDGKQIVVSSILGLIVNNKEIGKGDSLQVLNRQYVNATYHTRGIHSIAYNKYNELRFKVNSSHPYQISVKVFDDGVAFRYIVSSKGEGTVNDELTTFKIPSGSIVWSQGNIKTYEGTYEEQKIETIKKGQLAGPPLTFKLAGSVGYAAITEGGLTDFAGMSLISTGDQGFKANLTGVVHCSGVVTTPWRVILIGATLNKLVNSDVINNVSAPPKGKLFPQGEGTKWIKPGRCVWSWLAENGGVTFQNMKKFSDWGGELGFEYNLVDDGWAKWRDGDKDKWALMKELVDYSKTKNVKIWAWKAYPDRDGEHGIKDSVSRVAFFKKCKEIGIVGLKLDFFDTESQKVIDFYQSALKDAASLHLMLDFHGANKPTGESHTWPNEMTREGIMGLENTTNWAKHNTTLIFTRFLAGHADYTPLSFSSNVKGTTIIHQVATVAAFTSPMMCLGVDPEKLLKSEVKTMVKQIPTIWDETIILPQSSIGSLALMARRSGKVWFLVALNGEAKKTVKVKLDFLKKGNYRADILYDDDNTPTKLKDEKTNCTNKSIVMVRLPAGGGYIGRFIP